MNDGVLWVGLVWFYSISSIAGYLIANNLYIYIYIYIYISYWIIALTVRGKNASNSKIKIYNESLSRGKNIYILEKKGQSCHANWKKSTDTQSIGQKKKNTVIAAKLQEQKRAQYYVDQNSDKNYFVSQKLT